MKGPRALTLAAAGLMLIGTFLRVFHAATAGPLWVDEAMLSLNVLGRALPDLLDPLDYDQAAPVLFLVMARLATLVFGPSEFVLRLVPLLASIAALPLLWLTARKLSDETVALIALALAAFSEAMIHFAGEFKHYAVDTLVALILLSLAAAVREAPERSRTWVLLILGGILALFASITTPFVLAAVGLFLVLDPVVRGVSRAPVRLGLTAASWTLVFAVAWLLFYRHSAGNGFLREYWSGTTLDPRAPDFGQRIYGAAVAVTSVLPPLPPVVPIRLMMVGLAVGMIVIVRRSGWGVAGLVGAPFLVFGVASGLSLYPVDGRLLMFLAPMVLLAFASLVAWPVGRMLESPVARSLTGVMVVILWAWLTRDSGRLPNHEEGRSSIRVVLGAPLSEPVYVAPGSLPAWIHYTTDWKAPNRTRLKNAARLGSASGPSPVNGLVAMVESTEPVALEGCLNGRLEMIGRRSGYGARIRQQTSAVRTGWAAEEVARLRSTNAKYAWILATHPARGEIDSLRAALFHEGGRPVAVHQEHDAFALRVRLPAAPDPARGCADQRL